MFLICRNKNVDQFVNWYENHVHAVHKISLDNIYNISIKYEQQANKKAPRKRNTYNGRS
jgi:hypothetical protein